MIRTLLGLVALTVALCIGGATVAQPPAKKAPAKPATAKVVKKAEVAKLKKIAAKLDPEIKAAQTALRNARAKLQVALKDEVLKEKGPVEGKVIDQLKLSLKNVDTAIKRANLAQLIDKGGD
jgi:hypothetical protein